jgi:hypothetical protein
LFLPRCCGETITPASVRLFLTAEVVEEYQKKKIEFETPNRTYCSAVSCSIFIPPEHIQVDCGTCPACSTQTCTMCKAEWHGNQDCPSDIGLQLVLATASQEGWKRCTCGRMIEHNLGCNHMTYVPARMTSHLLSILTVRAIVASADTNSVTNAALSGRPATARSSPCVVSSPRQKTVLAGSPQLVVQLATPRTVSRVLLKPLGRFSSSMRVYTSGDELQERVRAMSATLAIVDSPMSAVPVVEYIARTVDSTDKALPRIRSRGYASLALGVYLNCSS